MARGLRAQFPNLFDRLRFFIGDVRDTSRLELAMRDIDVVVHAAALKIVPTAEYNPFECILTNVHGAENMVKAALRAGVKKVVSLSIDSSRAESVLSVDFDPEAIAHAKANFRALLNIIAQIFVPICPRGLSNISRWRKLPSFSST
jgi:Polysaccharide biosynthesis protein